jgi:uncharacterized protein YhdP
MIKKFFKSTFILLAFLLVLIVVLIKNPNIIGFFVEKFSHNKLHISNVDIGFKDGNIVLSSKNINLKTSDLSGNSKNINFVFDMQNFNGSLGVENLTIDYQGLKIQTKIKIEKIKDRKIITGFVKNLNIAETLPKLSVISESSKAIHYLQKSLKTGELKNINYTIIDNKGQRNFEVSGKIDNGYIKFHKDWEYIDNIFADFNIDNDKLILDIDKAKIDKIYPTGEVIVDWENELFVGVDVTTDTKTEIALNFLKKSPISKKLTTSLDEFSATGKVQANVFLHLPIGDKNKKNQVKVNAKLINNQFYALSKKIDIKNIDAKLKFNKNLSIIGTGNIFNEKTNINLTYKDFLIIDLLSDKGNYIIKNNNNVWSASLISSSIFGNISIDINDKLPKVIIDNLIVNTDKFGFSDEKIELYPKDIVNFQLYSKNIVINDRKIPDLTAKFLRKKQGLHIHNLKFDDIKIAKKNITLDGLWTDGIIGFWSNIQGEKLDDLFDSFDIKEKTTGGNFNIDLRGFCKCNPWELSLNKISGYGNISIKKGVFSEQDPNIGRVLSLLNINSLVDRLKLDLGDITNKGFTYDKINSEIILNSGGIAAVKNFKLSSSASKINVSGNSNIVDKKYNLKAEVIPSIKDSIPIATAIAGGGVTGLGVWLIDKYIFDEKLLNSIVGNVAKFEYTISGDWDNPQINKLK